MWTDPIVAEVRAVRQAIAAESNYDPEAIFQAAVRRQASCGHPVVSFAERTTDTTVGEAAPAPAPGA